MDIPAGLIAAFPPSDTAMFDLARRDVDDEMLMDIARADYGHRADEMFTALRLIRNTGIIPAPMDWQLSEVLTLTRYCEPDRPQRPPFARGPSGARGHRTRLFACATLLRAAMDTANENVDICYEATLVHCLISSQVAGDEMSEAIARFLIFDLSRSESSESLWIMTGLLIVVMRLRSGRFSERMLGDMAEWILEADARARGLGMCTFQEIAPAAFGVQQGLWRPLAIELRREAATIQAGDVRENLELCALGVETGY